MKQEAAQHKLLLLALSSCFVIPVLLLFLQSIAGEWRFPHLLPSSFSYYGWESIFQDASLVSALWTTWSLTLTVILLNLLLAFPAAKQLAFSSFRGKEMIETVLFLPIFIPALALAMGLHLTLLRIGLASTFWGVVLIHMLPTLPYTIRIVRAGFERLGSQQESQAQTLGASQVHVFFHITLPQLLPSVRAAIFLVTVISLSQYALTTMIGGGEVVTLALLYFPFAESASTQVMAAFSILFALLPLTFLFLIEGLIRLCLPYRVSKI
ncbi:ABC transporter permease [Salsuginibacillus kocurii]|uniref:ABC transporter permease n=1 Tax=Salsuginibacillus kocurii TaxID=427078 RepID=UPI000377F6F7|nr:ABC transporter permease subunit [Salsuginibacillus kocurii]